MDADGYYRRKTPRRAAPKCAQSELLEQLAGLPVETVPKANAK